MCVFIKNSGGEENREGEEIEGEWGRGESVEMNGKSTSEMGVRQEGEK